MTILALWVCKVTTKEIARFDFLAECRAIRPGNLLDTMELENGKEKSPCGKWPRLMQKWEESDHTELMPRKPSCGNACALG